MNFVFLLSNEPQNAILDCAVCSFDTGISLYYYVIIQKLYRLVANSLNGSPGANAKIKKITTLIANRVGINVTNLFAK